MNPTFWSKRGITWNLVSSSYATFCIKEESLIYSSASPTIFNNQFEYNYCLLGLLNSVVCRFILKLFNPTINTTAGDVLSLPYIDLIENKMIEAKVCQNISISKQDWDSHETSWDFEGNPILSYINKERAEGETGKSYKIESLYNLYTTDWEERFMQLHANEEEPEPSVY